MRMVTYLTVLTGCEAFAGALAALRMLASAGGAPLAARAPLAAGMVSAIVPVLDEEHRVGPTLAALARCGAELAEILVVDGGSTDGTRAVVAAAAARDARVRLLEGAPTPAGWNGKAWNLAVGLRTARTPWIATIDADVRLGPALLAAAVVRAERDELAALSVATRQEVPDSLAALLHPALLATLVYRTGIPNTIAAVPAAVQANGQVFVARRTMLVATDAFGAARDSRCEDVTVARTLAAAGGRIGFFEGDAVVRMHESWRDCATNWPRSLTLRDRFVAPPRLARTLVALLLAQALPLPTLVALLLLRERVPFCAAASALATALVALRLGVLAGTRRAYVRPPLAYWLSPLADLPAVGLLIASAVRRTHTWRGRVLVPERGA